MSLVINVKDAQQLEVDLKKFVNDEIDANNSGAFGAVESTLERGIADAILDAVTTFLNQKIAAPAASTGAKS